MGDRSVRNNIRVTEDLVCQTHYPISMPIPGDSVALKVKSMVASPDGNAGSRRSEVSCDDVIPFRNLDGIRAGRNRDRGPCFGRCRYADAERQDSDSAKPMFGGFPEHDFLR